MSVEEWLGNNQLSLDIWHNKYEYKNEGFEAWLNRVSGGNSEIKRLIKEKKFLFGGRTLANRGIPNSGSFSNCYSIGYVPDSLDGIMDVAHKIALTFKAQGGQGLSLSKIRPKGALIGGQYPSDGIVPFMNIFNTVTESVSQGGSRKGALLMSLDCWHPEIETFIKIKEDPNAINKANLSVEIDDEFMCHLEDCYIKENDKDELNPVEKFICNTFNTICESAWKSAEPGILFTDRLRSYNLMEFVEEYQIETTNPCGEQPLPKHGACNLCSINLSEYVLNPFTKHANINWVALDADIETIVCEMDKVLEENLNNHALPEQRAMAEKYRNIGIGIMGLSDLFVKLGIKYGSDKSIDLARKIMKFIFRQAVNASVNNAAKLGNFPGYDPKIWDSSIIKHAFSESEITKYKELNLLRNCSLLSIAPTGSIATCLEQISTGCEPFFAFSFNRKTVSMKGETYKVEIKVVEEYRKVTGNQEELPDYFVTAQDIPWNERIDMQAALQEFCDTAISSTVNLPKETTIDEVKKLYKYAWQKGCKGITIYRDGSRDPILFTDKKEGIQLPSLPEPQRGEIIKTGDHWLGLKRTLKTGCGTLHCEAFFDTDSGELRECYLSKGSTGGCNNFMIGLSRMISLAARGGIEIDKILDQLKSCGVCPSYAVRNATKKDCSKGSCCPVAVGNALKEMYEEMQYIICECNKNSKTNESIIVLTPESKPILATPAQALQSLEECPNCHEKTLTRQGGCLQCVSCGYSKCS